MRNSISFSFNAGVHRKEEVSTSFVDPDAEKNAYSFCFRLSASFVGLTLHRIFHCIGETINRRASEVCCVQHQIGAWTFPGQNSSNCKSDQSEGIGGLVNPTKMSKASPILYPHRTKNASGVL